jgi:hypothetical protein
VLAAVLVLALAAAAAATQLPTDAATDTLVDADTPGYRATEQVRREFGEEPVVVLAQGDLQQLILTANLGRFLRLEGCLSGNVPEGAKPLPGPCAELAEQDPVRSLIGPATFLNEAVIQIDRQLRRLAKTVPPDRLRELLLQIAAQYGITSVPSISNPDFLAALVFELGGPRGTPKPRLSYLFPNRSSAQIILRLKPAWARPSGTRRSRRSRRSSATPSRGRPASSGAKRSPASSCAAARTRSPACRSSSTPSPARSPSGSSSCSPSPSSSWPPP